MYNRQLRGRHLFSPVVVIRGGDHAHIYVAGKTSIQPDGSIGGVGDLRVQIGLVCHAVRASVEYVGATLDDVVRTVTYVLDIWRLLCRRRRALQILQQFTADQHADRGQPVSASGHADRDRGGSDRRSGTSQEPHGLISDDSPHHDEASEGHAEEPQPIFL